MALHNALTPTKINNTATPAKGADPVTLRDGGGLELRITHTGNRAWLFRYYRPGTKKRNNISLGSYPAISLADARKLAAEAMGQVIQGVDPATSKRLAKEELEAAAKSTFEALLAAVVARKAKEPLERVLEAMTKPEALLDNKNGREILSRYRRHLRPSLGNVRVMDITAPQVIAVLGKLVDPKRPGGPMPDMLARCVRTINEVMAEAINDGLISQNVCANVARKFEAHQHKVTNMPTLEPAEIVELMQGLAGVEANLGTRLQVEWSLHTLTRPTESATAEWAEIDWEKGLWVIPAEKMKKGIRHMVPLTDSTLAILEAMKPITGGKKHIFPGKAGKSHISVMTANQVLKRAGFDGRLVAHGLRSLGSTTLNEAGFEPQHVEAALAHSLKDKVAGAYNKANYLPQRAQMMAWWSNRIEAAKRGELLPLADNVIDLADRRRAG